MKSLNQDHLARKTEVFDTTLAGGGGEGEAVVCALGWTIAALIPSIIFQAFLEA